MANIPTIPGSAQVQDQQIGVKRDARPALAAQATAGRAFGAAAHTIEEASNVVAEYELRKHEAKENDIFNKSVVLLMKAKQQHLDALKHAQTDGQIDAIVPAWQQTVDSLKQQQLSNQELGPKAKQKLGFEFDKFLADSTAGFQDASDKLGAHQRAINAKYAKAELLSTGEEQYMNNAKAIINSAVSHGDMSREEGDNEISKLPVELATYQAQNAINSNPYKAYKELTAEDGKGKPTNFTALTDPNKRREFTNEAKERMNAVQGQTLQDHLAQIQTASNPLLYPSDDQLRLERDAGKLTASGYKRIKDYEQQTNLKESKANFDLLVADMQLAKLSESKTPQEDIRRWTEEAADIHDRNLNNMALKAINTQKKAMDKKTQHTERPIIQAQLDKMKADFKEANPDEAQAPEDARVAYGKKVSEFLKWASDPANKDAKSEQAEAERQKIEAPDAEAEALAAIRGTTTNDNAK